MDVKIKTSPHYMPILRAKDGEIEALAWLSPEAKFYTRPLVDISIQNVNSSLSLSEFLCDRISSLTHSWGIGHPLWIDMSRYAPEVRLNKNEHPVDRVFEIARQFGLKAIPVTGTQISRGPEADYLDAVADICRRDRRGVALRFQFEEFTDSTRLQQIIENTRQQVGVEVAQCDIIFDLETIDRLIPEICDVDLMVSKFRAAIQTITSKSYRSVILSGCSIPKIVGRKYNSKPCRVKRIELAAWMKLNRDGNLRRLVFGDYGIVYALQGDGGAPVQPPSRIRLSTDSEHILYRSPPGSYQQLRQKVAKEKAIDYQADCWGKRSIIGRGGGNTGVGNPTKWVARDTNAHIESTVRLINRELSFSGRFHQVDSTMENMDAWLQDELELVESLN